MWQTPDQPRIASWVQNGFAQIEVEMAPEGWEPPADPESVENGEGEAGGDAEGPGGSRPQTVTEIEDNAGDAAAVSGDTSGSIEVDETPEIARERALALLYDYYEADSDAEYALDQLLNRGWLYEVDGKLRVTEAEW